MVSIPPPVARAPRSGWNGSRPRLPALALALVLLAAACGSGGDSGTGRRSDGPTSTGAPAVSSTSPTTESPGPVPPSRPSGGETPGDAPGSGPATGPVSIPTPDGQTLAAEVFAPTGAVRGGVVLAHMRGANKETWFEFARTLAAEGYTAVAFDFRGYGGSSGERDTDLDVDVAAAVDFLTSAGVDRVFVMGASMGGTATVFEGSQLDLAGLVSLSGPTSFAGLDALAAAASLDEPALFVAAENDSPYADHARQMAGASGAEVVILSGHSHGTNLFGDHGPELTDLLLNFLAANS